MVAVALDPGRLGRITSSIAPAALGRDANMSPIAAWESVMGMTKWDGNRATDRGHRLEALALEYGKDVLGAASIVTPPFVVHPEQPWAGDSCDAIYSDDTGGIVALGEAKTVGLGASIHWGAEGTDEVPDKVLIQSCWHLAHHPAPEVIVPILVGGYEFEFRHYVVRRDDELIGILMQDLAKWHRDYVVAERMPPVTAADSEFLTRLYPRAVEEMLPPTEELTALAWEAIGAAGALKMAEERSEAARNRLREALGSFAGVRGADFSVSWRNNKDTVATDWRSLAMELGADEAAITRHSKVRNGPRVLRVTATKEKKGKKKMTQQEEQQ